MTTTSLRRLGFFLLIALTISSARAERYAYSEKIDRAHPFRSDGEITLSNTNGSVVIKTWERNEIRIEGEKLAKTEEELALITVSIDATETRLELKSDFPKRKGLFSWGDHVRGEVRLVLTVPVNARLRDIATTNGSIAIDGVRGPVRAHSVNGQLTAKDLAADTSLETVNGSINAQFASVTRDQKISTRTVNGSSTLAFPSDASLAFQARSVNGSVTCDFPLQLAGKTSRNRLDGTIGDGAASLKTETVNGSIRVKRQPSVEAAGLRKL